MLKTRIYNHLVNGKTQTWIAKVLHINKAYVCRVTNNLVKKGYIKPVSKNSRNKLYKATSYKLTDAAPVKLTDDCWEQSDFVKIDVHHFSYKFKVNERPRRIIFWDKVSEKLRSNVVQKFLYWPCKVGRATIRYNECPSGNDYVVIWMPSISIPVSQKDCFELILKEYVLAASAWLQRILLCRLSLMSIYRKPHFSVPLREPELRSFASGANLKAGDVWIDSSPPSNEPCFESSDLDKVLCYMELPNRVLSLEVRMDRVEDGISRINDKIDYLLDLFSGPVKPDERRDVV